jgi:hypothetical protein
VTLFAVGAMLERRQPVEAPRFVMPGIMGDEGPQE